MRSFELILMLRWKLLEQQFAVVQKTFTLAEVRKILVDKAVKASSKLESLNTMASQRQLTLWSISKGIDIDSGEV